MTCRQMRATFDASGRTLERVTTEGDVVIQHPQGQAVGGEAVFDPKTSTVELQQNPRVIATITRAGSSEVHRVVAEGKVLIWNQLTQRVSGKGSYRIRKLPVE